MKRVGLTVPGASYQPVGGVPTSMPTKGMTHKSVGPSAAAPNKLMQSMKAKGLC